MLQEVGHRLLLVALLIIADISPSLIPLQHELPFLVLEINDDHLELNDLLLRFENLSSVGPDFDESMSISFVTKAAKSFLLLLELSSFGLSL